MTKTVALLPLDAKRPALRLVVRPKRLALPDEPRPQLSWLEIVFAGCCLAVAIATVWAGLTPPVLP